MLFKFNVYYFSSKMFLRRFWSATAESWNTLTTSCAIHSDRTILKLCFKWVTIYSWCEFLTTTKQKQKKHIYYSSIKQHCHYLLPPPKNNNNKSVSIWCRHFAVQYWLNFCFIILVSYDIGWKLFGLFLSIEFCLFAFLVRSCHKV